jgi:hypothetical protein
MRFHLFEFEDLHWFPDVIRRGGTDYLRHFLQATSFYQPVVPILAELLRHSEEKKIVDLCSGGGGNIAMIATELGKTVEFKTITLTDKYPNIGAFRFISSSNDSKISYITEPVDAMKVPGKLSGVRTLFSAAHHFKPETIRAMLADAVEKNQPIAIFDGGDKNAIMIAGLLIVHPIAFILGTPFFKPFSLSRLILTYLVPLIPLMTMWDGAVSIMRLYHPSELEKIANSLEANDYQWKSGKLKNKWGMRISYLAGYPSVKW